MNSFCVFDIGFNVDEDRAGYVLAGKVGRFIGLDMKRGHRLLVRLK